MKQKIKKTLFYSAWLLKFSLLISFYLIISLPLRLNKKYDDLWIISERPDEARDNGYWLYKWILENQPNTNIRYALSKKSSDYKKMPHKELIVEPGSAKHYIAYILSSYSVSTHMHGACPGKSFCIPFLPLMRHKKTVFLQHGIIKDFIKLRGKLDMIVTSSEEERKLVKKANPNYKNNIYITGLCRYDQLADLSNNQKEKQILVMPTFRKWLRDIGRLKESDVEFKKTNYYRNWNSFLNNSSLHALLEKNNLQLLFFPHNEIQKLAHNFNANNNHITIGKPGEFDIQELLKKSSLLVTDYSSVFFDFVYMDKPVLFYQFDQDEFFTKHYKSSGKPYPFGDIIKNEEELIDEIQKAIGRNFQIKQKYAKDAKNFYKYHDNNNCERVYNAIKELK